MGRKKKQKEETNITHQQNTSSEVNGEIHYDVSFTKIESKSELVCQKNDDFLQYYIRKKNKIIDSGSLFCGNSIILEKNCEVAIVPTGAGIIRKIETEDKKKK